MPLHTGLCEDRRVTSSDSAVINRNGLDRVSEDTPQTVAAPRHHFTFSLEDKSVRTSPSVLKDEHGAGLHEDSSYTRVRYLCGPHGPLPPPTMPLLVGVGSHTPLLVSSSCGSVSPGVGVSRDHRGCGETRLLQSRT